MEQGKQYVLGSTPAEANRLRMQAERFDGFTQRLLADAGIGFGMRVLDLGTGAGNVAVLLARKVGPAGHVLSVDRDPATLASARLLAEEHGCGNIAFEAADIQRFRPSGTFDAIVGRFILMYLPDPAAVLRTCRRHLCARGVLAFHECDWTQGPFACPDSPLLDRVWSWIREAFVVSGADIAIGSKLHGLFRSADLPSPELKGDRDIGGDEDWYGFAHIAGLMRSVLPFAAAHGIVTPEAAEVDTLEDRLRAEIVTARGVVVHQLLVRAWARAP